MESIHVKFKAEWLASDQQIWPIERNVSNTSIPRPKKRLRTAQAAQRVFEVYSPTPQSNIWQMIDTFGEWFMSPAARLEVEGQTIKEPSIEKFPDFNSAQPDFRFVFEAEFDMPGVDVLISSEYQESDFFEQEIINRQTQLDKEYPGLSRKEQLLNKLKSEIFDCEGEIDTCYLSQRDSFNQAFEVKVERIK